jgi:hypothetical protein
MRTAKGKAARVPPLARPGKGAFMSVEELWRDHMPEKGRNQVYALATSGLFPYFRRGRCIDLLRKPTLQILRGDRPPGEPQLNQPTRAEKLRSAKRLTAQKKKRAAKSSEAASPAPVDP